jgi:chromosome segregation ATPase
VSEGTQSEFVTAMTALVRSERECRNQLLLARDRLADRDAAYAALEAEHWAGWERHERNARQRIEELEAEIRRLETVIARDRPELHAQDEALEATRAEMIRLQVRLEGIVGSAPYRLYARLQRLPVIRRLRRRRTQRFQERLASRRGG